VTLPRLLALLLEYDGRAYAGWQRQADGPSVQETLEHAVRKLTGRRSAVVAAGRTDAKAHAAGQVAHFRTASHLPIEKWVGALNANLPPDIAVLKAWEPPAGFHARFSAKAKTYAYAVWNARGRSALLYDRAWHVPVPLSLPAMRRAAKHLVGRHDFRAFAQTAGAAPRKTTVRRIHAIRIGRRGSLVTIEVSGNGFLTHMVRIITGTLVEAGKGRRKPASVAGTLKAKRRAAAGPTAPARGLTLLQVEYP
jgi:tRNA pseudouridine38-40 synthase